MDQAVGQVTGWLFTGFWVVFAAAVVVRLVLAFRRRRRGSSLRDSVLRPMLGAGTVAVLPIQDPRSTEHLAQVHGGAEQRTEISLVEPWPDEPRDESEELPEEPSQDPYRGQSPE